MCLSEGQKLVLKSYYFSSCAHQGNKAAQNPSEKQKKFFEKNLVENP